MQARSYQGTSFEVWNGNESWFWMVLDLGRNGGIIGAAATEDGAVRDARAAIEEIRARARKRAPETIERDLIVWRFSLARLARYLARIAPAAA